MMMMMMMMFLFYFRRMCDLLDDPSALGSGPRKSQQGESLGTQLGELANLITVFICLFTQKSLAYIITTSSVPTAMLCS
jgi:hypothetical protein